MHVRYNLLQSHLIRLNRQGIDNFTNSAGNGPLDVLVAVGSSGTQDHQIPLAVLSPDSSLIQSRASYHLVSRTRQGAYSLDVVLRAPSCCTAEAADASNTQSAAVHRRRLCLRGRSHTATSLSSLAAATAAIGTAACPPAWQLQQQCLLPSCKGLQLLPGKVSCCCLLVADAQIQQQQVEELQQLLQQAGAVWLNSSSSSSRGEQVIEVLAAAAAAAVAVSSTADDCSNWQPQLGAIQCGPVVCSSSLYNVIASALATSSIATNSNSPPCMFLAATTSGQVWVCDPRFALIGSSSSSSNSSGCANGPAGSDTAQQLHQQQHKEMRQQSAPLQNAQRRGLRLLLDLQQPVIALLPISHPAAQPSSSSSGGGDGGGVGQAANAFLFVGSLGRVGLLHLQQKPKSGGTTVAAAADPAAAAAAAAAGDQGEQGGSLTQQLRMLHHQLPFAVQAAAVASCPAQPQQQQQHGQQQQQQQPSWMTLLLLSGSGSVYVADLNAAATAATASSSSSSKSLQLQKRKLQLPGHIGNLWVLHPQPPQQQRQQGIYINAGGFPAGNAQEATNSSSSIVILQLQGSNNLLHLILDHSNITQQPQQQQQQLPGQADTTSPSNRYNVSVSSSNVAAAAAAARRKLQGLMSALEILSTARESLEHGTVQQDEYLTSVANDLALLRGLTPWGRSPTQPAVPYCSAAHGPNLGQSNVPTGGIAVTHTATTAQQQQQQQQVKFTCDIQGLWPAPAAAAAGSTSCSSSMHMAVTIHLQAHSSSSSSGCIPQLGFSPGWQLLVTFTPESAQNPTWQTTVPLSLHSCHGPSPGPSPRDRVTSSGPYNWPKHSSSDCSSSKGSNSSETGYVCASLLLPLPEQCMDLSEGGWLQAYAVKQAPSGLHLQLTSSSSPAAAGAGANSSSALPAVALSSQQYVSVLQLSSMLATNPAAAVLSAPATAAAAAAAATGSSGPSRPYSCILQLQAVQGPHAPVVQQLQLSSHKRSRADLNGVVSLQQCQQQRQASSSTDQQQRHKLPLGALLGDWLESVAVAPSHGLGHSSSSSSSSSNLSLPGQGTQLALLRGQVSYNLGQGAHGQLTWASGPLIPHQQQQQQATTAPSTTAAAAASLDDGTMYSNVEGLKLPVQVAMQASNVTGWAQMHRSFVMAVLQQLQNASTGADGITAQDIPTMHRGDNSSTTANTRWCIAAQKQQLQKALHQFTQLHQQLMGLQDTAEKAADLRAQVLAALDTATGSNEGCISVQSLLHQEKSKQLSSAPLLEELRGVLVSWESRICVGYGRAVLAASTASCLLCYEA